MHLLTKGSKTLRERFFYFFIFLLPTQLSLHFWPEWAHVFGVRVDYLAPSIYFTDLLFLGLCVLYIPQFIAAKKITSKIITPAILLIVFGGINIAASSVWQVSLLKWIKLFELILIALFVSRAKVVKYNKLAKTIIYSTFTFSLIGIVQFIKQGSLGGFLYFLGEREMSSLTPGIAKVSIFGQDLVRAYSVFSHPNSFAGYLLVSVLLFFFLSSRNKEDRKIFPVIYLALMFTFSRSVILVGAIIITAGWVIKRKKVSLIRFSNFFLIFAVLTTTIFFILSSHNWSGFIENSSLLERMFLITASGKMIIINPLMGVGLGNFVIILSEMRIFSSYLWTFQPVHNIFLLSLTEVGLIGLGLFLFVIQKALANAIRQLAVKNKYLVFSFFAIIFTGLFDHYWLTLQQNQLLLALVIGLSLRKTRPNGRLRLDDKALGFRMSA